MIAKTKTKTLSDTLKSIGACEEAIAWAADYKSPQEAWDACERGDWLLWAVGRFITCEPWTDGRKPLLACCLDCAETAKKYWPKKQAGVIGKAIAVLRKWISGDATVEEAREARKNLYACAAADAAAGANAATTDAYAAAYAAAAAADYAATTAADPAAYAAATTKVLNECAKIVRKHFPKPPMWRKACEP